MPDARSAAAFQLAYDAMLARFPARPESRDVETPGAHTRVQVWGAVAAPPLVMLHGFKVTATMWAPNAAALGAVRRVYAPDTLGDYGFSHADKPPRNVDGLLDWLVQLLDALELGTVDIGGMSYGGWLAAHFAARHPDRVGKLVMIAPGAAFAAFSAAWYLRGLPMVMFKRKRSVAGYLRWAAVAGDDAVYNDVMDGLVDVMHAGHHNFPMFGLPLPGTIAPEVLQKIKAPALLVYGANEKMHAAERAVAVAKAAMPSLESVVIPEASHDLTMRQAAKVNAAVVAFLQR
ncbi:MAG: carboxylesterase [Myxococcales bacterium]|nr:carboxylesterase [Myxococcales bacterium]